MKTNFVLSRNCLLLTVQWMMAIAAAPYAQGALRPVDYVNPLIGTAPITDKATLGNMPSGNEELYTGTVNPGAKVPDPNGNLQVGPLSGYDGCCGHMRGSGYRWEDKTLMGFSHFSAEYGRDNFLVFMPTVGAIRTTAGGHNASVTTTYRSAKDTAQERAGAGYYTVFLTTYGIKVELTSTKNSGFHRYTFPASQQANVLIDLANARPAATAASVTIVDNHTIEGYQNCGGNVYFRAVFSKDFTASGTWTGSAISAGSNSATGASLGAYATFTTTAGEQIQVKVGTSRTSQAQAASNLAAEIPGMDFETVHQQSVAAWTAVLGHITVEGGSEADRMNFYSSMYRLTTGPSYGGGFMDFCAPWTVRAFMRGTNWFTQRTSNMSGAWGGGGYWGIGTGWAPLGMYNRGFRNFNMTTIYNTLRGQAMTGGTGGDVYRQYGWVPPGSGVNPFVNHSLGLAFDDYVLSQYAKILGNTADYDLFLARSKNYAKSYNASVGHFMPRRADGTWQLVDPINVHAEDTYREGNAWNYLFYVMGDIPGLIKLLGDSAQVAVRLDTLFNKPFPTNAVGLRDVTGLIGLYSHANEQYRHVPFMYNYIGQPWKTQALVRKIQKLLYRPIPAGLCGMDDHGMTTGWFVSSAMGFYHVDPTSGVCDIGSPLFPKVTINLDGATPSTFVIEAHNVSDANMYIQSATLNGKPLNVPRFNHSDIIPGGSLVFEMGPQPNRSWGLGGPVGIKPSPSREGLRPIAVAYRGSQMMLDVTGPANGKVAILDGKGRVIANGRINAAGICRISMRHDAGAVYFARVTAPDGNYQIQTISALN